MDWGSERRAHRREVVRDTAFALVIGVLVGLGLMVADLAAKGAL
jgi:hypothetical protein